jgi:hypothetical protein
MTRHVSTSAVIDSDWKQVSQAMPCPVCGAHYACSVHTVEHFAFCAHAPSEWKLTNGSWLHALPGPVPANDVEIPVGPSSMLNDARP